MRGLAIRMLLLDSVIREQHYRLLLRPSPRQIGAFAVDLLALFGCIVALWLVLNWTIGGFVGNYERDYQQMSLCLSELLDFDPYGAHRMTQALEVCERRLGLR